MIRIIKDSINKREEIFTVKEARVDVSATVAEIIAKVRAEGDAALKYYTEKFDKASLTSLRVTEEEIAEAVASVEPEFIRILETAAEIIRLFADKKVFCFFFFSESIKFCFRCALDFCLGIFSKNEKVFKYYLLKYKQNFTKYLLF